LSLLAHTPVLSAGPRMTMSVLSDFLLTASAMASFISLIYDLHEHSVSSSLGHRVLAAANLSLRHTTSIFLTRTKVYSYKGDSEFPADVGVLCSNTTTKICKCGGTLQNIHPA